MEGLQLPLENLRESPWNANVMDEPILSRLRQSIERFGLVGPLVVRPIGDCCYETVGGGQRLAIARQLGFDDVPCVVVDADDAEARLLSQCLNRIAGEDDLGVKAELIREVLEAVPQDQVIS